MDLSWFKDRICNNNIIMVLFSQNTTNNINNYQYYYYIFMMHLYLHLLFGGKTNAKFNLWLNLKNWQWHKFSFLVTQMLFQFTKKIITSLTACILEDWIIHFSLSLSPVLKWCSDFKTKSWKDTKFTPQLVNRSPVVPLKASRKAFNILIHQFFFTVSIILDYNWCSCSPFFPCHNYALVCNTEVNYSLLNGVV